MSADLRWSKFYWADYEGDIPLRRCSLAAQGLWMRMLCIMAQSSRPGYLCGGDNRGTIGGESTPSQPRVGADSRSIARSIGVDHRTIKPLLIELEREGVFSRDQDGIIYNRRLAKAVEFRQKAVEHGRRGGNPTLKGKQGETVKGSGGSEPEQTLNGGDKHKSTENREHIKDKSPPIAPQASAGVAAAARVPSAPPGFAAWWSAYPRKVGKDAALRAYQAALKRGATDADLIAGLRRQQWAADPKYIPHPATWLNGGRWQDDPKAAAPEQASGGTGWQQVRETPWYLRPVPVADEHGKTIDGKLFA